MTACCIGEKLPHLPPQTSSSNWVILDPAVDNLSLLVAGVTQDSQIFILDSSKDGVEQITQLFQTASTLPQTLHLISHGTPGTLYLGQGELSLKNLDQYAQQLQSWSVNDFLIYGCQVAAGDAGTEFLAKLQQYTGANIAASATKVGHTHFDANWDLDITLGQVQAPVAFTPQLMAAYAGAFATPIIYVQDSDNENNTQTGVPDGDFGRFIRVGSDGARDVTNVPPNEVETLPKQGVDLGQIQPIEFNIFTTVDATIGSAFLFLAVFDVDAPNEVDRVSFNNTPIGFLEGENGLSFKSVFRLNPASINLGKNLVQIEVDLNNQGFEAAIEKAELLINYELGQSLGTAFLDVKETDELAYNEGDTITFTGDIDTTLSSQNLKVEVILRDPTGVAVDFDDDPALANLLVQGQPVGIDGDTFTWSVPLPNNAQMGIWRIDISAFDVNGDFQFIDTISFPVNCGEPAEPSVFQFKQFVLFEQLDENRPYQGENATFDETLYLNANPDIKAAVANGLISSGLEHFTLFGQAEGRSKLPLDYELGGLRMASLFDETYYLGRYSDIQTAVLEGRLVYGYEHFLKFGIQEGRLPSYYYDDQYYLNNNLDVKAAVEADLVDSGLQHFILWGHTENRNPSELFNANDYLLNNPDVQLAIAQRRIDSAFDHYIEFGASESRAPGSLLYEEAYYLLENSDVATALGDGRISSGFEHYVLFGQSETFRDPSPRFNESAYLGCHPDVALAVEAGLLSSGMEHYFRFGRQEGRVAFEVPAAVV